MAVCKQWVCRFKGHKSEVIILRLTQPGYEGYFPVPQTICVRNRQPVKDLRVKD